MARPDETVMVLNDYGFTRRERSKLNRDGSTSTKARYTVSFSSEPVLVGTDPRALTKAPAQAIAEHLRQRIEDITATASPATLAKRASAAKALAAGESWPTKRYSGGRMGTMAPNQSDRLFNDSGRFAKSIAVGATKDGWVINVAANRLDPRTATEAGLLRIVERLREFVPEWGNAKELANVLSVRRAINQALAGQLKKANERTVELEVARLKAVAGLFGL